MLNNRICLLTSFITNKGGGVYYVLLSLSAILTKKVKSVFVLGEDDGFDQSAADEWGEVDVIPYKSWSKFGYSTNLNTILNDKKPDLIHLHGFWMYFTYAGLRQKKYKRKLVVSPHGTLDTWALNKSRRKKKIIYFLFGKRLLDKADCIHALCYEEYQAIRRLGIKTPVAIIPNGVSLPENNEVSVPGWVNSINKDRKNLLFFGRVDAKKGVINLVRAFEKLLMCDNLPAWNLIIAGWGDVEYIQKVKDLVRSLGLTDNVYYIGPQFGDDKTYSFTNADAFILPSYSEGLPMAVLEAWSYGLPCIITPECNLKIGFERAAAIKISPDMEGILSGLKYLVAKDDDQLREIGDNGYKLVADHFSWEGVASQYIELYNWIINKSTKPKFVYLE